MRPITYDYARLKEIVTAGRNPQRRDWIPLRKRLGVIEKTFELPERLIDSAREHELLVAAVTCCGDRFPPAEASDADALEAWVKLHMRAWRAETAGELMASVGAEMIRVESLRLGAGMRMAAVLQDRNRTPNWKVEELFGLAIVSVGTAADRTESRARLAVLPEAG